MKPAQLSDYSHVYFLGIGGIGMSALARWFAANGYTVGGYDKTPSALTRQLELEGCQISYSEQVDEIPTWVQSQADRTLVVITPAIPAEHEGYRWLKSQGYPFLKRAQVLGLIASGHTCVAVAGTHGKTTTSALVAHMLFEAGRDVTAFLGGISQNYHTNLLLSEKAPDDTLFVAEADEFDRSFLTLFPDVAIINSVDPDHLDIYGRSEAMLESYAAFASQVKGRGALFLRHGISLPQPERIAATVATFGQPGESLAWPENIRIAEGRFLFDLYTAEGCLLEGVKLISPGYHNVMNAVAAACVGLWLELEPEQIRRGLETFRGTQRRFDYQAEGAYTYIDDYAHHPTEIETFLRSVKALYPGQRLTVVFQPHLFSRTRDFLEGFAQSLTLADELVLLEIYPAREKPIEGITSQALLDKIPLRAKHLVPDDQLLAWVASERPKLLVTVGAGDIDRFVQPLRELYQSWNQA